jgi:hypothetical protein
MSVIDSVTFALKRLTKSENTRLSISVALISLVILSAAAFYYTSLQPHTLQEERTLLSYRQQGAFDYTAYLKPNTVYNGVTELGPLDSYFAALVESVTMAYSYEFTLYNAAGTPIALPADALTEYEVAAILGEGDFWEREYLLTLRQPTTSGTDLDIQFQIPIQAYQAEAETVRSEVNTPGRDLQLRVEVRIWPLVSTEAGDITTPFVHELLLRWTETELVVEGARSLSEIGSLTESISVVDPQRIFYQRLAMGGMVTSLLLMLSWFGVSFWASRTPFTPEQMYLEIQRRYGEVIVEALALPAPGPHQMVIPLRTFEDIGRTAHELMRPIIVVVEPTGRRYTVVDGIDNVRYEYWLGNGVPAPDSPEGGRTIESDEWGPVFTQHRNGKSAYGGAFAGSRQTYPGERKNGTQHVPVGVAGSTAAKPGSPISDANKTDARQEK